MLSWFGFPIPRKVEIAAGRPGGMAGGGTLCCMHWFPNVVALIVPLKRGIGCGSCRRSFPTLESGRHSVRFVRGGRGQTYGGCANGIPRNCVTVPLRVPMTVASSSLTVTCAAMTLVDAIAPSNSLSKVDIAFLGGVWRICRLAGEGTQGAPSESYL